MAACGAGAKGYADFRKLLEDKNIQGVVVSTPDHWHALATIMACAAGKDVYVEKPMTVFLKEGRWMTQAARKYNRVVQAGTQQRSGKHFQEAVRLIQSGHIGKVVSVRIGSFRNIMPGFGVTGPSAPPNDFDYNMWLGPAPERPYTQHRALYHFRWFWDYSGGQMTNLGTHQVDIVHMAMRVKGPSAVTSMGGRLGFRKTMGKRPIRRTPSFNTPASPAWSRFARRASETGATTAVSSSSAPRAASRFRATASRSSPTRRSRPTIRFPPWSKPAGHPPRVENFKPEAWTER